MSWLIYMRVRLLCDGSLCSRVSGLGVFAGDGNHGCFSWVRLLKYGMLVAKIYYNALLSLGGLDGVWYRDLVWRRYGGGWKVE